MTVTGVQLREDSASQSLLHSAYQKCVEGGLGKMKSCSMRTAPTLILSVLLIQL